MSKEVSLYCIHHIPESDRPRERLLKYGPEAMATAELLAVILGSGIKGISVLQLAQNIVTRFSTLKRLSEATVEEFCQIKGLGRAKAIQLRASLSLGMRASRKVLSSKYKIKGPTQAYHLVKDELQNEKREMLVIILQDVKGYVINHQVVSIGTLSHALIHPREIFYPAVRHKAASLILVHNHPSGDPDPSKEDFEATNHLIEVGKLMGIPINDHLIIGENSFVSLRQKGVAFAD